MRAVVDRQDEPALDAAQHLREAGEVGPVKHATPVIRLMAPVGRVDIEEREVPVIARDEFRPVQPLDMDAL